MDYYEDEDEEESSRKDEIEAFRRFGGVPDDPYHPPEEEDLEEEGGEYCEKHQGTPEVSQDDQARTLATAVTDNTQPVNQLVSPQPLSNSVQQLCQAPFAGIA